MRKTKARRTTSTGKASAGGKPARKVSAPKPKSASASRTKPPAKVVPPKSAKKTTPPPRAAHESKSPPKPKVEAPIAKAKSPKDLRVPGKAESKGGNLPGVRAGRGGKGVTNPIGPPPGKPIVAQPKDGKPVRRVLIQTGKPIAGHPSIAMNRDPKRNALAARLPSPLLPRREVPPSLKIAPKAPEPKSNQVMSRKTSFKKADLQRYQQLLLDKRESLVGDVRSMESQAFRQSGTESSPNHMADYGSDTFEQDFTLGLIESDEKVINEINKALERITNQTYGVCETCAIDIPVARLDVLPWAALCVKCQAQAERF